MLNSTQTSYSGNAIVQFILTLENLHRLWQTMLFIWACITQSINKMYVALYHTLAVGHNLLQRQLEWEHWLKMWTQRVRCLTSLLPFRCHCCLWPSVLYDKCSHCIEQWVLSTRESSHQADVHITCVKQEKAKRRDCVSAICRQEHVLGLSACLRCPHYVLWLCSLLTDLWLEPSLRCLKSDRLDWSAQGERDIQPVSCRKPS